MINKYIWNLYLNAGGEEVVNIFEKCFANGISEEYVSFLTGLQEKYCASSRIINGSKGLLQDVCKYYMNNPLIDDQEGIEPLTENDVEDVFSELYKSTFLFDKKTTDKEVFLEFSSAIAYYSTVFAIEFPGVFIPYYFYGNYNVFAIIAETFGIELPKIPAKSDYKGRVWHYLWICNALNRFSTENDLSIYELYAFLYDFAPNYIGGKDSYILKDLPDPKSAFFVGGGGNSSDASAEDDSDMISLWQCNPDTRAGDMIVMYLTSPISSISSVWRSYSVGFNDPFFYYYRCTYIGLPQKVKRISLNDIKNDNILAKMPIVNKNMQGINGVELKPSEYNHIVEMTGADVPVIEFVMDSDDDSYINEKAVEENLIKPLLLKLDYAEDEYVRQLSIPVGNHNTTLIPDFVLLPKCSGGHYSAFAIIEAKRTISNNKQLEDTIIQTRSYAKILGARYAAIASQEGIWVFSSKDDYTESIFESRWSDLKDKDTFYSLRKLLGNWLE